MEKTIKMKKFLFNYESHYLLDSSLVKSLDTFINKNHMNLFYSDNIIFVYSNNSENINKLKNKFGLNYYSFEQFEEVFQNFKKKYCLFNLTPVNVLYDLLFNQSNLILYFDDPVKLNPILKTCKEFGNDLLVLAYISNNYLNVIKFSKKTPSPLNSSKVNAHKFLSNRSNISLNLKNKLTTLLNLIYFFKFNLKILYFITKKIIININAYGKSAK